jgi:DNA-binding MarR family transcriptional regulator
VLPLPSLLSAALVAFTVELDNEFEHRIPNRTSERKARGDRLSGPWLVSVAMWANCLRYVTEDGVTVAEVERLARTHANLDGMRRWGYVTLDGAGRRGGARRSGPDSVLRLTDAGRQAHQVWAPLGGEIEQRWRLRFGTPAVDRLRDALQKVVRSDAGSLPDTLPILRYRLFCEVDDLPAAETPSEQLPAAETPSELPLGALLSRGLLVFALGYERGVKLSLAVMLDVVRVLDGNGVRVTDLPRLSGVSKEAIAMALGLLEKAMCAETWSRDRRRMVRLTDRGLNARRRGLARVRAHEASWRERFGDEAIDELRGALEPLVGNATRAGSPLFGGLEPHPDGWRADRPQPDTLPWFPMVLHRGGWPDGS